MGNFALRATTRYGATVSESLLLAFTVDSGMAQQAKNIAKAKEYRIERSISPQALACIECHKKEHPGIFSDWANSRHASANITCLDCHEAEEHDPDVSVQHYKQYQRNDSPYGTQEFKVPISAVVTPKDCSRCHPDEATQYARSKHANTLEIIWKIDPWLNKGMNSDDERLAGCYHCHLPSSSFLSGPSGAFLFSTRDG